MLGDSEFEDFHPYVDFASKNDEAPPELADAIRHLSQTLDTDQRAIFDPSCLQIIVAAAAAVDVQQKIQIRVRSMFSFARAGCVRQDQDQQRWEHLRA